MYGTAGICSFVDLVASSAIIRQNLIPLTSTVHQHIAYDVRMCNREGSLLQKFFHAKICLRNMKSNYRFVGCTKL